MADTPGAKPVVQAEELGTLAKPHHRLRPDVLIMDRDFRPVIVETSFEAQNADAVARLADGVQTAAGRHSVLTPIHRRGDGGGRDGGLRKCSRPRG